MLPTRLDEHLYTHHTNQLPHMLPGGGGTRWKVTLFAICSANCMLLRHTQFFLESVRMDNLRFAGSWLSADVDVNCQNEVSFSNALGGVPLCDICNFG